MDIIRQLGSGEGIPAEAIRAATADRATVTPLLVDALEKCEPGEVEEPGLFFAFHLLGQWREKSAYRPLARFLRRPGVDRILGDAITSTCHRVMANVFDGDPNPIYEVIRDTEADEFLRGRMFDSLVLLAFRGEFDRTELASLLRASFDELQPRDYSMVWDGWQRAVALLAMDEFEPLVRKAFESGFIDPMVTNFKHFKDDLQRARAVIRWIPGTAATMSRSAMSSMKCQPGRDSSRSSQPIKPRTAGAPIHGRECRPEIRSAMSGATIPVRAAAARNSRSAASASRKRSFARSRRPTMFSRPTSSRTSTTSTSRSGITTHSSSPTRTTGARPTNNSALT